MVLIVTKILIPRGYRGLTIFPFVFIRYKEDRKNEVLLNHERIHLRQQLELLILPFFIFYGLEFVIRLFEYKNFNTAYRNISFEREAYSNEKNLRYLNGRKWYSFTKYLL
ncbi:hypothetical protein [Flavobacterium sp. 14A]|uniref:hypothetical protein n=1 Tax=Flavobacterium sp. 14A TaxID=2735896 RepID=UPI00156EA997|nr:hypothetical protein [Flavobacterium sp. 14A]NRT11419.1 hypothetical protein [Flavobacterium sp. 14A]